MQNTENKGESSANSSNDPSTERKRSYYYDDAHGYEEYDPKKDTEVDEDAEEFD